jgi:hypothetical protein
VRREEAQVRAGDGSFDSASITRPRKRELVAPGATSSRSAGVRADSDGTAGAAAIGEFAGTSASGVLVPS